MAPIKVLIAGAGIAGNALAFWLDKLGYCDVTVVERFSGLRTKGLQVDLRGAGVDVLRRMGLEKEFRALAAPEQGMQIVDKSGRQRAYFPANQSGKGPQSFTSEFEIMRGNLCRLIHDAVGKDRTNYVFGTSMSSFQQKDDGSCQVHFTNGTTERFDLVVGADGVGSLTRKMMLGCPNESKDPSFHPRGNSYVAYFTIRRPMELGEEYIAKLYVATGHRIVLTRRHSPHEIQVCLIFKTNSQRLKDVRRGDVAEEKAVVAEIFRGAGWLTDSLLESMEHTDNFYCERQGIVKLDSWSSGRVALVGDAAYCPSANGFGTSLAMVGAYIMAGEIGRCCGPSDGGDGADGRSDADLDGLVPALKAYEEKLRPFMDRMHKKEAGDKGSMASTSLEVAVFNYLVGVASFLRLGSIFMRFYHPEKGLKLPEYGDILRA